MKIFKDFHKNIIGKGGATIKKIKEETDTRIDLPSMDSDSDSITVTGRRDNVERAREMIEKIQREIVCTPVARAIIYLITESDRRV